MTNMTGWDTYTIFEKTSGQNFDLMTKNFRHGDWGIIHRDIKPYPYSTLRIYKTQFEFQVATNENLS